MSAVAREADDYVAVHISSSAARRVLAAPPEGWGDVMGLEDDLEGRLVQPAALDGHELGLESGELRLFFTGISQGDVEQLIDQLLSCRLAGRESRAEVAVVGHHAGPIAGVRGGGKQVKTGDVFRIQLEEGDAVFGRVVDADFALGKVPGLALVYVYDLVSNRTVPDLTRLTPHNLLVPVQITNKVGWRRGAFQTVLRQPLLETDVLPKHRFQYWDKGRPIVVDDQGAEIVGDNRPVHGVFLLTGYDLIIDEVRAALGRARSGDPSALK